MAPVTRLVRMSCAVLVILMLASGAAWALDRAVVGQKILIKRASSGKEKLVVFLKDPALLFPAIGGADDPSASGMLIELLPGNGDPTAAFIMPPGLGRPGWTPKDRNTDSYKFVNRDAPDGISEVRVASLREGRLLKIVATRTGLALASRALSVGVRVTTGALRNCALFTTPTIQRDEAGLFKARKAPPPVDCQTATLLGQAGPPVCGDGIITGPEECDGPGTCAVGGDGCAAPGAVSECTCCPGPCPVECGDGIINGSEECDGPNSCPGQPVGLDQCVLAGAPNECTCCSDTCPFQSGGCCQPSVFIPEAGACGGVCIPSTCTPPFSCGPGAQCLPDESCCVPAGTGCYLSIFNMGLLSCCPGSTCGKPDVIGLACCLPEGGACASDAECCSDSCNSGGTCDACLANGAACTDSLRCCSLDCGTSGTCECLPAGNGCLLSAQCCSGSCDETTRTCDP